MYQITDRIKAGEVNFVEIDGQMQKLISIQARRREFRNLRQIGTQANGTPLQRLVRRVVAWLNE